MTNPDDLSARKLVAFHRKQLNAAIKLVTENIVRSYRANNPTANDLSTMVATRVYAKRPKGFSSYYHTVVVAMLASSEALRQSNALYIADLQAQYPTYVIPKGLMSRPIPAKAKAKLVQLVKASGRSIPSTSYDSLSKIKLALRGSDVQALGARSYRPSFIFGDDEVSINGKPMTIFRNAKGHPRIRVAIGKERQWLRSDVLEALLGEQGLHSSLLE